MAIADRYLSELKNEFKNTSKILEAVPFEHKDWKPHEKSMSLIRLSTHIAELAGWLTITIEKDELDFSKEYNPEVINSKAELISFFNKNVKEAENALSTCDDETMNKPWSLRNGDELYFTMPKKVVLRTFVLNHLIHHRGQLTVYLRLLNIPVPGCYGPSADLI